MVKWVIVVLVAATGLLLWRVAMSAKRRLPGVGDAAPEFELPDQYGKTRSLREFRGRPLVVYFFPRADTPACSEQAARYRDSMQEIETLGAAVCGVSVDGSERLERFAAKYRLPFALLSDRGGAVTSKYGSLINLGLFKFARRNTFLVDPRGCIARVYLNAQPARDAGNVLADIKELQQA